MPAYIIFNTELTGTTFIPVIFYRLVPWAAGPPLHLALLLVVRPAQCYRIRHSLPYVTNNHNCWTSGVTFSKIKHSPLCCANLAAGMRPRCTATHVL
jgi:hypothetical protein